MHFYLLHNFWGCILVFFTNLQRVCDEHGISISALLDSLDLSRGNIGRWKSGLEPKPSTKNKLAAALNVSPNVFDDSYQISENDLSDVEKDLLSNFRKLSQPGKEYIMQTMMLAVQTYGKKNSAVPELETAR